MGSGPVTLELMFALADVLAGTGGRLLGPSCDAMFEGVSIDSRSAGPGDLFVAFRGERVDGHDFVEAAFRNRVGAALVQRIPAGVAWARGDWSGPPVVLTENTGRALADLGRYWRRRSGAQVIAVTGSIGKTSTKEAVAGLLSQRGPVLRTQANLNTEIGLPISLMRLEADQRIAVLELGMQALGEIRTLARICEPNVGIVTNVHPTHLERLGTIERIAEAKAELIQELPPDGLAVLNADDPRVRHMAQLAPCQVTTYGIDEPAEVRAGAIEVDGLRGVAFDLSYRGNRARATMRTIGRHSVYGALAAIAAALHTGMSFEEAAAGLQHVEPAPRLVPLAGINGCTVLDDTYNANPASMLAALDVLALMEGRRIAVLADMMELGSDETEGHAGIGRHVATTADRLLAIGARAEIIATAAVEAGMPEAQVESCHTNAEAVVRLQDIVRPGDTVLLKGSRAMRLDEIVSALRAGNA